MSLSKFIEMITLAESEHSISNALLFKMKHNEFVCKDLIRNGLREYMFSWRFPSSWPHPTLPTSSSGSSIYRYTSIRSTWRIKDGSRLTEGNQSNSTFLRTSQRIRIFIVNLFVVMIYLQNYSNRATRYFYYEKK